MNGCCEALRILFVWLRVRDAHDLYFISYSCRLCSHTKIEDDDKKIDKEIGTFTDDFVCVL